MLPRVRWDAHVAVDRAVERPAGAERAADQGVTAGPGRVTRLEVAEDEVLLFHVPNVLGHARVGWIFDDDQPECAAGDLQECRPVMMRVVPECAGHVVCWNFVHVIATTLALECSRDVVCGRFPGNMQAVRVHVGHVRIGKRVVFMRHWLVRQQVLEAHDVLPARLHDQSWSRNRERLALLGIHACRERFAVDR